MKTTPCIVLRPHLRAWFGGVVLVLMGGAWAGLAGGCRSPAAPASETQVDRILTAPVVPQPLPPVEIREDPRPGFQQEPPKAQGS